MTKHQILKSSIIKHAYTDTQHVYKAIEEANELYQALGLYNIYKSENAREALISEMADVTIMIERMTNILNASAELNDEIDFKLDREIERIKKITLFPQVGEKM